MIRLMKAEDYQDVYNLWDKAEEVCINPKDDTYEKIQEFLLKNPELCYVATNKEKIIGAIMAGYDGRRGHIYHTVVSLEERNKGIGNLLVDKVLEQFNKLGVHEIDLLVVGSNSVGNAFWQKRGFLQTKHLNYCRKVVE